MIENNTVIKYSKAETEKFSNKLKRLKLKDQKKEVIAYAQSNNVNKKIASASYEEAYEFLKDDNDARIVKALAESSIKRSPKIAKDLLKHNSMEVRSLAAVALAKKGALTNDELCELDIPIIRTLISKRLYLMEIAKIHKHGDIKKLLNEELNIMSRRDNIEVKEIRDVLNAHPFRQGDISFEVLDELEEEPVWKIEVKEENKEEIEEFDKATPKEKVEIDENELESHQPDDEDFESEFLSSILD